MNCAGYPRVNDLIALLGGEEQAPDSLIIGPALRAGIEGFEKECGRKMLAGKKIDNSDLAPSARTFYERSLIRRSGHYDFGLVLDLGQYGDLARVDSVVHRTSTGDEAFTLDTDYIPLEENALDIGQPYTRIELRRPLWAGAWGFWSSNFFRPRMVVTGLWGYSTVLPDDAWMAMLLAGALTLYEGSWMQARARVLSSVASGSTSSSAFPVKAWTGPGGISETYATDITTTLIKSSLGAAGGADAIGGWAGTIARTIDRYRRVDI